MKLLIAFIMMVSLLACTTPAVETPMETPTETPTETPVETPIDTPDTSEPVVETTEPIPALTVRDYFPDLTDVIRTFEGEGNEFARFTVRTEYVKDDFVQFHSNNGGTETVDVYEVTENEVRRTFSESEIYFRENHLNYATPDMTRILLQAPLEVGHSWEDPLMGTATIIALDEPIEILDGLTVRTIAVETGDTIEYYAPEYGLVKRDFQDGLVTSTLREFEENTSYKETIRLFTPNEDLMDLIVTNETMEFRTNDIVRQKIAELLRRPIPEGLGLPHDFEINSMYKNRGDGRGYIDVSDDIRKWNVGSSAEALGIDGMIQTIGNYLQVSEVYLWVDGEGYESGHFMYEKDDIFEVRPE